MTIDDTEVALARRAADALRDLGQRHPDRRPEDADRFAWSADALDELARVADLLAAAVDHAAGDPSRQVEHRAHELATAIIAHRNSLLRHGRGAHPFPRGGDGARAATAVPSPYSTLRPPHLTRAMTTLG